MGYTIVLFGWESNSYWLHHCIVWLGEQHLWATPDTITSNGADNMERSDVRNDGTKQRP